MIAKPKIITRGEIDYFKNKGADLKDFPLIRAAYNENLKQAEELLESDPNSINQQDPYAGLTALHIGIFRQNEKLVALFATHPKCDLHIVDNFNRKAIDMLNYTINQTIFETVMDATYPDEMKALEEEAFEESVSDSGVVPFRPKEQ